MRYNLLRFVCFLFAFLLTAAGAAYAQLPTCSGTNAGVFYAIAGSTAIYNYNPGLPTSATNPSTNTIAPPAGAIGITVGPNINAAGPSPTFYVVTSTGNYFYHNGTTWVNTGHNSGNTNAVNIAAGGGYIFNITTTSPHQIYRYNGTGNGTLLTNLGTSNARIVDVVADCAGNFYSLDATSTAPSFTKYDANGNVLQNYTITGTLPASAGARPNLSMIGNQVYFTLNSTFYVGTLTGTNLAVVASATNPFSAGFPNDFGSCPLGGVGGSSVQASVDTGYYCGSGPGLAVTANGSGPFTWTVISGPATVTPATGPSVSITATGISRIVVQGTLGSGSCTGDSTDTVTVIVPTATVDAGANSTVPGCGVYRDTLQGMLSNTTAGLTYNIAWTPTGSIVSGGATLTPIVAPAASTTYTLTVFTPAAQGGCTFTDTVRLTTVNQSVAAGFNYAIRYGCAGDTVDFVNTSTALAGTATYYWDFGDGATDTAKNPTHFYPLPGTYSVKLMVSNGPCKDSLVASLPLDHPLDAAFTVPDDTLCQSDTVFFTNTTIATTRNGIAPRYFWNFGDGTTDTAKNPAHHYTAGGVYIVILTARDFVPCTDIARDTIVVDSLPQLQIALADTALCEGQATSFAARFTAMGNTGLSWSYGDGTFSTGDSLRVTHGYDAPGQYNIILSATYRRCPDTADTVALSVRPFPSINIGPDTSICPGAEPILLTARLSGGGGLPGGTQVVWSTRDTASSILVRHHGEYWARAANDDGCSATDTVIVAKDCYLDLPNSFTPNGDGTNDSFWPRQLMSEGLVRFSMRIYNRWGQKVWETTSIDGRGWDGKFNGTDQLTGVYIYLVEAELKNGYREKYQGNVTLLR